MPDASRLCEVRDQIHRAKTTLGDLFSILLASSQRMGCADLVIGTAARGFKCTSGTRNLGVVRVAPPSVPPQEACHPNC